MIVGMHRKRGPNNGVLVPVGRTRYLAELVDRFIEDDTRHPEVYTLMLEMLRGIEEDVIDLQQRGQAHEAYLFLGAAERPGSLFCHVYHTHRGCARISIMSIGYSGQRL